VSDSNRVVLDRILDDDPLAACFHTAERHLHIVVHGRAVDVAAPQSWFSVQICLISARNSISIRGRPPREFDFQRQKWRKPARCQYTSVSGRTIVTASRINRNHRYIWMKNQRSLFVR
jgi:hypothetical protein